MFVGTAASRRSAEIGAPYAGPGNKFWEILYSAGFVPERMEPRQFESLPDYGIGLSGMAPRAVGNDNVLTRDDFDPEGLRVKIAQFKPHVLAFVGKRAAQEFLGRKVLTYGHQTETIGDTTLWVLPSTSGAARRYWDESPWRALAQVVLRQDRDLRETSPQNA